MLKFSLLVGIAAVTAWAVRTLLEGNLPPSLQGGDGERTMERWEDDGGPPANVN